MAGQEKIDDKFEQDWKNALDGIEEAPPLAIWNELDRRLTYEELAVYKTRIIYYKWSAAAVILIAVLSGLTVFLSGDRNLLNTGFSEVVEVEGPLNETHGFNLPDLRLPADKEKGAATSGRMIALSADDQSTDQEEAGSAPMAFAEVDMAKFEELALEKMKPEYIVAANYEDKEIFKVATYDFYPNRRKKNGNEKYWAGIGVGRGSFDPNFQSEGNTLVTDAASPSAYSLADNEAVDRNAPEVREGMSSGATMALGLNFGLKVGDRWSLESGVQYARSEATTTTNVVITTTTMREIIPASSEVKNVPQVQRAISEEKVVEYAYQDVDLANEFQFATIPLKAGYLIVDSRFKFEVNAGVAANVYLGNKLTAQDEQFADATFGPGNSSPYRELSFSGLAGVQLGYEFFNNFDLIVEPNYRRSINSLTKDNSTFITSPSGFGVMTGIRYRFN